MDRSRLYYQIPCMKSFIYTIEQCEKNGKDTWPTVLSQTGSCLEGGGQPFDIGTLNGVAVLSVHEGGNMIIHELATPLEPETLAEDIVGWQKWYSDIQQHTGEHILSGLVHRRFGYDNVEFHMRSEEVTVDFNGLITPEQLGQLENEADQTVYDNVPVKVLYSDKEEPDFLDYRSEKELTGPVRIVKIPDADMCTYCGARVENTGEVGTIKIRSMIHYKGGARIFLLCGRRALLDYRDKLEGETRLPSLLSARFGLVPEAVKEPKNDLRDKKVLMGRLYGQIFSLGAEQYPEGETPLALFEKGLNMVQIHQLSTLLYERKRGSIVMVCSPGNGNEEYQYTPGSGCCNMCALSGAMNRRLNGQGGGSALVSQGTFRADKQSVTKAFLEESALLMETNAQRE